MTSTTRIKRMTPAQLRAREAELETELDSRKTATERQAEGMLAHQREDVHDDYDPSVDTSVQQAALLLEDGE